MVAAQTPPHNVATTAPPNAQGSRLGLPRRETQSMLVGVRWFESIGQQ